MSSGEWDYPELIANGTAVGPVTIEMRDMCQAKVRRANKLGGRPEDEGMEYWPDMLPSVRRELKQNYPGMKAWDGWFSGDEDY